MEPLTLERIENFVDLHNSVIAGFLIMVLQDDAVPRFAKPSKAEMLKTWPDVCGNVSFRLLEDDFVSLGNLFAYPSCHIFRSGIEVEKVVEIAMVEPFRNQFFQVCKVDHHSVSVQCFSTAIDGDDAVVPMKPLAFALVVKP